MCTSNHNGKWIITLTGRRNSFCVACFGEIVSDGNCVPVVQLQYQLQQFLEVMNHDKAAVCTCLSTNRTCAQYLCNRTLALSGENDVKGTGKLAAEVLLKLLLSLADQDIVANIISKMSIKILETCDYRKSLLHCNVLGKLIKEIDKLPRFLVQHQDGLVEFLLSGLDFPNVTVQTSLSYLAIYIYSAEDTCEYIPEGLNRTIINDSLNALDNCSMDNDDLVINLLGLLKTLLGFSAVTSDLFASSPSNKVFIVLKKILLSGQEEYKNAALSCVNTILQEEEKKNSYISVIIEEDLVSLIYECLNTSQEPLLKSTLQCLGELSGSKLFFDKQLAVYGIDSLIRSIEQSLANGMSAVAITGIALLAKFLQEHGGDVCLFSNQVLISSCVGALREAVCHSDHQLSFVACHTLCSLFRFGHQLGLLIWCPYADLETTLGCVCLRCQKQPSGDTPVTMTSLKLTCTVLKEALRFAHCVHEHTNAQHAQVCYFKTPLNANTMEDPLEHFVFHILYLTVEYYVPVVQRNLKFLRSRSFIQIYLELLSEFLLRTCETDRKLIVDKYTQARLTEDCMAFKSRLHRGENRSRDLATNIIYQILMTALEFDDNLKLTEAELNACHQALIQGCQDLEGSTPAVIQHSYKAKTFPGSAAEATLIVLVYCQQQMDKHFYRRCSADVVQSLLVNCTSRDDLHLPKPVLKCLILLFIWLYRQRRQHMTQQHTEYEEACVVLGKHLQTLDPSHWCVRDINILPWVCSIPELAKSCTDQLLTFWLSHPGSLLTSDQLVFSHLLKTNSIFLASLLKLLLVNDTQLQNIVFTVFQQVFGQLTWSVDLPDDVIQTLGRIVPEITLQVLREKKLASVIRVLSLSCLLKLNMKQEKFTSDDNRIILHALSLLNGGHDSIEKLENIVYQLLSTYLLRAVDLHDSTVAALMFQDANLMKHVQNACSRHMMSNCDTNGPILLLSLLILNLPLYKTQVKWPLTLSPYDMMGLSLTCYQLFWGVYLETEEATNLVGFEEYLDKHGISMASIHIQLYQLMTHAIIFEMQTSSDGRCPAVTISNILDHCQHDTAVYTEIRHLFWNQFFSRMLMSPSFIQSLSSKGEKALVILIQAFLSHSMLSDECLPLRLRQLWHKYCTVTTDHLLPPHMQSADDATDEVVPLDHSMFKTHLRSCQLELFHDHLRSDLSSLLQ